MSKTLDGKPQFNALYGMYPLSLNKFKAVLKVSGQVGHSGGVFKTSVESVNQDDDFREVK